jgi:hypothetical protein
MSKEKKESTITVSVRITPTEDRLLQKRAAEVGTSKTAFAQRLVIDGLRGEDATERILERLADLEEKVERGSDRVVEINMRMFKDGTDRIIEVLSKMFKVGMLQAAKFDRNGVGGFPKSDELNRFVEQRIIQR